MPYGFKDIEMKTSDLASLDFSLIIDSSDRPFIGVETDGTSAKALFLVYERGMQVGAMRHVRRAEVEETDMGEEAMKQLVHEAVDGMKPLSQNRSRDVLGMDSVTAKIEHRAGQQLALGRKGSPKLDVVGEPAVKQLYLGQ